MRQIAQISIFSLIILSLSSCGLFDSGSDTIVDDYDVTWIDLHEQRALYKGEQLVPPYVFAAGHNDKYVFAKQHPLVKTSDIIDLKTTNYFIIERTNEIFQDKKIYGPLNENQFKIMCEQLCIDNPGFELTYPTNLKW